MSSNNDDVEYTITHNSDENKLETYTTWQLWIRAQKMQEAERIFNHHVYCFIHVPYVTFCDFIVFCNKTDPTFIHFLLLVLYLIHHCIVFC